jgi:hypothetical protein
MRRKDEAQGQQLYDRLVSFARDVRPLPGVQTNVTRTAYVEQILESIHRIQYIATIRLRPISPLRADASSDLFDPLKAALVHSAQGNLDEAFWLTFLATHFGRHRVDGWRLVRDVYAGDGLGMWTWTKTSAGQAGFRTWLRANEHALKNDGVPRRFGNHRKYETLRTDSNRGTASVLESYIQWVGPNMGHAMLLADARAAAGANPHHVFDHLYRSMGQVISFGRTGRFDYLTMLGKLGLAPIEPGSPYLDGATGPLAGARLLFGGARNAQIGIPIVEAWTIELGNYLGVGMQVMEDSLCNWQKSPARFVPFRG